MCGIAGIRRLDSSPVDEPLVAAMIGSMAHRGPDATGSWTCRDVGLGHCRLSIIDPGGSAQPMASVDRRSHLVFNGEILNYRQLRSELSYPFTTLGDTEVLLALYDKYGPEGVNRLRGQFAFALYDSGTGDLHLFRDRLGILPLYYYKTDRLFAFASEIKGLLPVIGTPTVDQDSLYDYLTYRSVPSPYTLLQGVHKVPPGHHVVLTPAGDIRCTPYWQLPVEPVTIKTTPRGAVDLVEEALTESVREALVADVPVGAYLSGGLDSSLVTSLMAEMHSGGEVNTYSAGFGDDSLDETHWARRVADHVGTRHHELTVTADDFERCWSALSWHRDAPLSEPSDVAVFRLAELAGQHVKVLLSGEGADELFAGYPKHRYAEATRWLGVLPSAALRRVEKTLPAHHARLGVAMRAMSEDTYPERMRGWFAPFTTPERAALLGGQPARSTLSPFTDGRGDALHRMLYADVRTWLCDNLLERGDRMSMAASVELRPPFLDHRLVELAFALPSNVKLRGGTSKWVLKEVARKRLPAEVVDRPKLGFKVPLDKWFRGGLRDMAFDSLTGPSSFVGSTFDRTAVTRLLRDHSLGERNEQPRIWALLSLEVWHQGLVGMRPCRV